MEQTKVQIFAEGADAGTATQGEISVLHWNKKERLLRAFKFSGLCLLASILSVLIPLLHFVLVPSFFIASFVLFFVLLPQESLVTGGKGICPHCEKDFSVAKAQPKFPLKDICSHCHQRVKIEPIAGADPKDRFSDRVENYVKWRPSYPSDLLDWMSSKLGNLSGKVIADIGSGTGIFSKLLVERGAIVFGVEPNQNMRKASEKLLENENNFSSVDGTSDVTGLKPASVDAVTAAQAFHWFEPATAKAEWQRILKPGGKVFLIWNNRRETGSKFLEQYESFLRKHGTDYLKVKHQNAVESGTVRKFFEPYPMEEFSCTQTQEMTWEGTKGRLLSSSYVPKENDSGFDPMIQALDEIFKKNQVNGKISFTYDTKVFFGTLN